MIKVAVVEDDVKTISEITALVERFFTEKKRGFFVQAFPDGAHFMLNFRNDYDVILLDINMPVLNGMATAKKIRETDDRCALVFITNLTQYVFKGYEVSASGYIIKPVTYDKFKNTMELAVRSAERKQKASIAVRVDGDVMVLTVDDIQYIDIVGHDLYIHTNDTTYRIKKTLSEFESSLGSSGFSRASHSCLINLKYVRSVVKNDVILFTGAKDVKIPLSRTKKKPFIDALLNYSR